MRHIPPSEFEIACPAIIIPRREIIRPKAISFWPYFRRWVSTYDAPGSASFTTPGSASWVVVNYSTSCTIRLWGGGGGGGNVVASSPQNAGAGTASTCTGGLSAGGGGGGQDAISNFPTFTNGSGGAGGTASGGDTNTNGEAGQTGYGTNRGGNSPSGGNGGAAPTGIASGNNGNAPGGGGSGMAYEPVGIAGGAGGAGAFVEAVFALGELSVGATLSLFIGSGGPGRDTGSGIVGGNGGNGKVEIIWV